MLHLGEKNITSSNLLFQGGGKTAADVKIKFTVSHIKPCKLNNTSFSFLFMFKSSQQGCRQIT